jgi:hypothetical protein
MEGRRVYEEHGGTWWNMVKREREMLDIDEKTRRHGCVLNERKSVLTVRDGVMALTLKPSSLSAIA